MVMSITALTCLAIDRWLPEAKTLPQALKLLF
jgi:hypothetical protein